MDKLAELGRAQHKRHQTQDWARNLEDEDINVELSDNETEDSEFTDASILKRKLLFKPKEDKPPKSVKVANQYEILTVREEEPMETIEIPSENARQVTSNSQKSKPKLPPIVVAGTANYSKISKTMKTTMTGTFKIFYIRDGLKIHTSTLDDFKTLQAYLKQTGQEYHTFTLPRDKPLKLVIKGLPPNMPTDDIKEELHTMGYTATDIRQFTSKTQTENAAQDIQLTFTLEPMTYKTQVIEQNQIRILIWNANGILQQTQEFEDLMQTYGIDLALVCETHLKPDKRLNITGYDIYRTDRVQQRGGGTAVFIKSYLPHYRNNVEDSENLEATSVTVNTKNGHINFVATYNPPTKMLLKTDLDIITADNNFLIGGDLNSKNTLWNSRLTNRNGRILEEHATEADYNIIAPESPTFYPANHLHRPDTANEIVEEFKSSVSKMLSETGLSQENESIATGNRTLRKGTNIQEFYRNCNLFVTGGTGFIGKILIEKLLRSCPAINKIYVVIRPKKSKSPEERKEELIKCSVFDVLKATNPDFHQKLVMVPGDISLPKLGLSSSDYELLTQQVNIILHLAATVKFDEKINIAVPMNIGGTKEIIDLCRACVNLKSIVYLSTAYSNCNKKDIEECFYDPPLEDDGVINFLATVDEAIMEVIKIKIIGTWPNTYTFTKAIAENIIKKTASDLPIAIVRPSQVSGTLKEPVCGWIDNVYGPNGAAAGFFAGLVRTGVSHAETKLNMIPVDMVANCIIASALEATTRYHSDCNENIPIYNYVSGPNTLTFQENTHVILEKLFEVPSAQAIWYPCAIPFRSVFWYRLLAIFVHVIPGALLDIAFVIKGYPPMFLKLYRKIDKYMLSMKYFTTFNWNFDNRKCMSLYQSLALEDKEIFYFDSNAYDWRDYLRSCINGLRIYLFKESPDTIPAGKSRLFKPDVLDIVLTNLKITPATTSVLQELDSDHNLVLCEWDVNTEHQTSWQIPTTKTTDWTKFKTDLQEIIPENLEIESVEDVDAAIDIFTTTVQETYNMHTTTSRKQQDLRIDHPELNYLIAQKREARRDW
uniref:Fatty acyl-CoA reductase n=1 Tax=Timema cristinae TaxID=61476 RepID=A0A7R9CLQ5_TIMCR|nr:unnamed protein product [Timema cristinae]